jgi:hypothetical protein
MSTKTKARRLLEVAYATYRSNEKKIAADIFELAMQDPSASAEFGADIGQLKIAMAEALTKGDFATAEGLLDQMKSMQDEPGLESPEEDEAGEDEGEAATSPGDVLSPTPAPELAPAQVASLVALARKVKLGGHADLAGKITKALGL